MYLGLIYQKRLRSWKDEASLSQGRKASKFNQAVMPHLRAAHNLAFWLTRNASDAEDVVQEAYLRAFEFFDSLKAPDARPWLLSIVRNTCYTWLKQNRSGEQHFLRVNGGDREEPSTEATPDVLLSRKLDEELVRRAIESLPVEYREVIVLRELNELSYKEISSIIRAPVGTVMSRLARARKKLQMILTAQALDKEMASS